MSAPPPRRRVTMPENDPKIWPILLGLLLPLCLILASGLLVPHSVGQFLGISLRTWCLFACAPLTSIALAICYLFGKGNTDDDGTNEGDVSADRTAS